MKWREGRRSQNVQVSSGGGGVGKLGLGGVAAVVVISLLLGKNPLEMLALLTGGDGGGPVVQTQAPPTATRAPATNDPQTEFVARVLGDTEDVWGGIFQQMGTRYQAPKLTLYHGQIASACGFSSAAAGPFYCPGDRKVYLDLTFFQELSQRFGAPGDFARAYVIAHEIGHHVQNQLGLMEAAQQKMANASDRSRNDLSVRLELQADCLAGVWGHSSMQRNIIDAKDVESGMAAAAAVGDDRIQKQTRGYVVPEGFTHGSSAQRAKWFRTGLDSGDLRQCDTFGTRNL